MLLISVIPALGCILKDLNLRYSPSVNKRDYLTAFCNRYRLIRTNWYFCIPFSHKGTLQCRSYMVKIYLLAECSFIGSLLNPSKMLIISFNNWNSWDQKRDWFNDMAVLAQSKHFKTKWLPERGEIAWRLWRKHYGISVTGFLTATSAQFIHSWLLLFVLAESPRDYEIIGLD